MVMEVMSVLLVGSELEVGLGHEHDIGVRVCFDLSFLHYCIAVMTSVL